MHKTTMMFFSWLRAWRSKFYWGRN